jgi:hypothetical protein
MVGLSPRVGGGIESAAKQKMCKESARPLAQCGPDRLVIALKLFVPRRSHTESLWPVGVPRTSTSRRSAFQLASLDLNCT